MGRAPGGDDAVRGLYPEVSRPAVELRSYTVYPSTVVDVKVCSTQLVICDAAPSEPPPGPWPPWEPTTKYPMSPAATHALNSARVGASSEPLNPPTAITALPEASWIGAADIEPVVAAAQRLLVACSRAVRELPADAVAAPGPPAVAPLALLLLPGKLPRPGPPPIPPVATGPDDGVLPVCAWDAVLTA